MKNRWLADGAGPERLHRIDRNDRELGVQLAHQLAHRGTEGGRRHRAPQHQRHVIVRCLRERSEHFDPGLDCEARLTLATHDPDDGVPDRSGIRNAVEGDPLAHRILILEVLPGEGLVDHHNRRRVFPVRIAEHSPRSERDAHDAEIARCGRPVYDLRAILIGGAAGDVKVAGPAGASECRSDHRRCLCYSGQAPRPSLQFIKEADDLGRGIVLGWWEMDRDGQDPLRIKTGVNLLQPPETADQKPRSRGEQQCQSDLGHHQGIGPATNPAAFARRVDRLPSVHQRERGAPARSPERRQTEPAGRGDRDHVADHAPVESNVPHR